MTAKEILQNNKILIDIVLITLLLQMTRICKNMFLLQYY